VGLVHSASTRCEHEDERDAQKYDAQHVCMTTRPRGKFPAVGMGAKGGGSYGEGVRLGLMLASIGAAIGIGGIVYGVLWLLAALE
jgi:hypothetical protein